MLHLTSIKEEIKRLWVISGMMLTEEAAELVQKPVPVLLHPQKSPMNLH